MIIPAIQVIRSSLVAAGTSAELGNIGEIVSAGGNNHGSNAKAVWKGPVYKPIVKDNYLFMKIHLHVTNK